MIWGEHDILGGALFGNLKAVYRNVMMTAGFCF